GLDGLGAYGTVFGFILFSIPVVLIMAMRFRKHLGIVSVSALAKESSPRNKLTLLVLALLAGIGFAPASAEAASQGLNALQYRPVNDGVGSADKAQPTSAG